MARDSGAGWRQAGGTGRWDNPVSEQGGDCVSISFTGGLDANVWRRRRTRVRKACLDFPACAGMVGQSKRLIGKAAGGRPVNSEQEAAALAFLSQVV